MQIRWNKSAVQQLLDAIRFIEENNFQSYAEELEREILSRIKNLPINPDIYPLDKYRRNNDNTYHAFELINTEFHTEARITRLESSGSGIPAEEHNIIRKPYKPISFLRN